MKFGFSALAAITAAFVPAAGEQRPDPSHEGPRAKTQPPVTTEGSRIPRRPPPPRCDRLQVPSDLPLYVIAYYDGATLSTTWISEENRETHVIDVEVEAGSPIHLVITSYGRTIYRFAGTTSRIARLTLMSHQVSGATGIPAERIAFTAHCLSYDQTDEANVGRVFAGRSPAAIILGREVQSIRVDDGIELREGLSVQLSGTDPETDQLYHYSPGGISRVDHRTVVSSVAVGPYRTLPQEAGVRQLVMSGALIPATQADARRWEAAARARGTANPRALSGSGYGVYRVTRPILMPAGLCGAHLIHLYARSPRDIGGDPCHSTFYFDDGTMSNGATRERGPLAQARTARGN